MRIPHLLLSAIAALALASSPASAGDQATRVAAGGGPTAVLLLLVTTPDGTQASFGQGGGDAGPAGVALAREIEALGFRLRPAAGKSVAVSGEGGSLLPVGDDAALDLARRLGASSAWVVGLEIQPDGPIRGTRLTGAAARGALRVLDVATGRAVGQAEARGGGFDVALPGALTGAAQDAAARLVVPVSRDVSAHWPPAISSRGAVMVRVRGARTWGSIGAIIQKLGTTEGISAVHASQVWRGRIALAVETALAPARVAAIIERARLPRGTVRAAARGRAEIEAEVHGESTFSPGTELAPGSQQ